jgi:hypothetical protein
VFGKILKRVVFLNELKTKLKQRLDKFKFWGSKNKKPKSGKSRVPGVVHVRISCGERQKPFFEFAN